MDNNNQNEFSKLATMKIDDLEKTIEIYEQRYNLAKQVLAMRNQYGEWSAAQLKRKEDRRKAAQKAKQNKAAAQQQS